MLFGWTAFVRRISRVPAVETLARGCRRLQLVSLLLVFEKMYLPYAVPSCKACNLLICM
jgi:hypothetical protein